MAVQDTVKKFTIEKFLAFCDLPENADRRFELINGEVVEMAPSSKQNTILALEIGRLLGNFVRERHLGYMSGADGGYELGSKDVRLPDVGYVSKARAGGTTGVTFPAAPDLAVEVISPSETSKKVRDKVKAFLDAGSTIVWTVYPEDRVIDVYRRAEQGQYVQTYAVDDTLDGGDVLPGFSVKVSDIFSVLD